MKILLLIFPNSSSCLLDEFWVSLYCTGVIYILISIFNYLKELNKVIFFHPIS